MRRIREGGDAEANTDVTGGAGNVVAALAVSSVRDAGERLVAFAFASGAAGVEEQQRLPAPG